MPVITDPPGQNSLFFLQHQDTLLAGDGDDVVFVLDPQDAPLVAEADGGPGTDTLIADLRGRTDPVVYTVSQGVATLSVGALNVTLTGFELLDLQTGAGHDRIFSGDSRDKVQAGAGDDVLSLGGGDDEGVGGAGDDTLWGGTGNDTLLGLSDDDYIDGGTGDDSLEGGGGQDILVSFAGTDTIDGGTGDDILHYARTTQSNIAFDAKTGIFTRDTGRIETVVTEVEQFVITTTFGFDTIATGAGDDYISTGAGDDVLEGGLGQDVLVGGAGDDRFVFTFADTTEKASVNTAYLDRIKGFDGAGAAQGDLIDLRGIGLFQGFTATNLSDGETYMLAHFLTAAPAGFGPFIRFEDRYLHLRIADGTEDASAYTRDDLLLA